MPCFSLLASKVLPLVSGVHLEYLESTVQATRNGGLLPSCTSRVFVVMALLLLLQYASKLTWSQFLGTSLPPRLTDRVTESSTVIRIPFCEAAFANAAIDRRPSSRNAFLRTVM